MKKKKVKMKMKKKQKLIWELRLNLREVILEISRINNKRIKIKIAILLMTVTILSIKSAITLMIINPRKQYILLLLINQQFHLFTPQKQIMNNNQFIHKITTDQ